MGAREQDRRHFLILWPFPWTLQPRVPTCGELLNVDYLCTLECRHEGGVGTRTHLNKSVKIDFQPKSKNAVHRGGINQVLRKLVGRKLMCWLLWSIKTKLSLSDLCCVSLNVTRRGQHVLRKRRRIWANSFPITPRGLFSSHPIPFSVSASLSCLSVSHENKLVTMATYRFSPIHGLHPQSTVFFRQSLHGDHSRPSHTSNNRKGT